MVEKKNGFQELLFQSLVVPFSYIIGASGQKDKRHIDQLKRVRKGNDKFQCCCQLIT